MEQSKQKPVHGGYEKELEFGSTRDSMGLSSTCKSRKHKISLSEYYIELPNKSSSTTTRKHKLGRSEYYIELPKQLSSTPSRKHKLGRSEYYIELPKQSPTTTTSGKRKISQSEYYIELPKQSSSSTSRERKISRSEYYIELPKKPSTRNKRKQEINTDKSNQPSTSNRTNECRDHMQPSSHKKRKQDIDTSRDNMELATELASCKKIKQETGQSPEEVKLPRQEPLYSKTKHILCNVLSKASFSGFMKCVSKTWKALLPSNSLARCNNYHNSISGLIIQRQLNGIEGIPYAIMNDDSVVLSFPIELDRYNRLRIYASSGGLLLCNRTFSNFIYNPLTGEQSSVPEPVERRHSITWDCAVAFHVFDKLRYVLLRVFSSPIKGNLLILKFDSDVGEWRESSHPIPPPHNFSVQLDTAAVFLNGRFHWVSRCGTQVLIHDLEDGSVRIITSPVVPNTYKLLLGFIQMVILGEYQGKLCYCGMDMKSECFTMWVLDSEDRWLLKNTTSMQRMRDEHKQVVGSDDSLVPLLLCFDAGDPGAVFLEWRTSKYDGSRFSNIVRYNMVTARHQFITKINNRSYSEMIDFHNFIKPGVSE